MPIKKLFYNRVRIKFVSKIKKILSQNLNSRWDVKNRSVTILSQPREARLSAYHTEMRALNAAFNKVAALEN